MNGTLKDGKEDGKWISWYENGQKQIEGTYKDGKPEGKVTYWSPDDKESSEMIWKNGEQWDGKKLWFHDVGGQRLLELIYKDGKEISSTWWDEDGNLRE